MKVSLCDLVTEPERYDGHVVQVKGVLHENRGEPFLSDHCSVSSIARIAVLEAGNAIPSQGLPSWATSTSFCGDDPYPAIFTGMEADVIIIGSFKVGNPTPQNISGIRQPYIVSWSYLQISWEFTGSQTQRHASDREWRRLYAYERRNRS